MKGHLDAETLAALAFEEEGDREQTTPHATTEYAEARAHLRTCAACTEELAAHRALLGDLAAIPAPAPSAAALEKTKNEIVARIHAEARRKMPTRDVATGVVTALIGVIALVTLGDFEALADLSALDVLRWTVALLVLGAASVLGTRTPTSMRQVALALGGTVAVSVLLAALDLLTTDVGFGEHYACEKITMLVASAPLASALLFVRGHARSQGASMGSSEGHAMGMHAAFGGAAGALAGQAALFTTCASAEGVLHVLGYHVLAVVGVVLASAILGRLVSSPAAA